MIEKIEQYCGVAIDSMQNNSDAPEQPLILLDADLIKKSLINEIELTVLESIDSTNNYFKTQPKTKTIKCCLSEQQTQGRGRLNRSWHSPFGKNLYLSCYYPIQKDMSELAGLSLVVGLSILATLRSLGLIKGVYTKWPNDVLCRDKKIAGILIDVQAESQGMSAVTIGIGLNVNMLPNDAVSTEFIEQAWTSLAAETGLLWNRNDVVTVLLDHLLAYVHRFEEEGFTIFIDEWMGIDGLMGKIVTLNHMNDLNNCITGEVMGINSQGHLLLRVSEENIRAFSSGEVTVVKK